MRVIRIDEFRAVKNRHDELRSALASILDIVREADGCSAVDVFQSATEPERIVVVERWTDRAAHQRAMASVPSSALHHVMTLLSEIPGGSYYADVSAALRQAG